MTLSLEMSTVATQFSADKPIKVGAVDLWSCYPKIWQWGLFIADSEVILSWSSM